jgi:5-methylcytosine-specific restriction enzyme A
MPSRPMTPCKQPGCPALVKKGWCEAHARTAPSTPYQMRQRADAQKGEGRQFYSTPAWRALRAQVIREQPRCADCPSPTRVADHIKSRRDYPALAMTRSNLVGRCLSCHNTKTAREDGGFGNRKRTSSATTGGTPYRAGPGGVLG